MRDMIRHSALAFTRQDPHWVSSKSIRQGIVESYQILHPGIKTLVLENNLESIKREICRNLFKSDIKRLIYIDPSLNPLSFVSLVKRIEPAIDEFCFHVYGNFLFSSPEWLETFKELKGKKVKLVAASRAQANQLKRLLGAHNGGAVDIVPFPVSEEYFPLPIRRDEPARDYKKDGEFLVTYAGRISPQKNVHVLLRFLHRFSERHPELGGRLKVAVAGDFDELGRPAYKTWWEEFFKRLKAAFRGKVNLLGSLSKSELRDLYEASDLFASLSTFRYEDFGMAPLESLLSGCPVLLSEWGGYRDFQLADDADVRLVPVRFENGREKFSYEVFENELIRFMKTKPRGAGERLKTSKIFRSSYRAETIAKKYADLHASEFVELRAPFEGLSASTEKILRSREEGRGWELR